ncbi:MAG: site-specific integrase [Clostridiales bacterium]|nr:site-specific integrase [Clostridiales bacterium]
MAYLENKGEGMSLSEKQLEDYINYLGKKGIARESCSTYRNRICRFLDQLPDGWKIKPGSLAKAQEEMLQNGLSASTINGFTTAVNGLLDFCGHRELQVSRLPEDAKKDGPQMTREEYLRLLSAARSKGRERVYLVMKTIASSGILIEEIPDVTVEAAQKGYLEVARRQVSLPDFLCGELLDYAARMDITSGIIICTRNRKPIDRSNLNHEIKVLSAAAGVPAEKCTPRCLRQLYQRTQREIRENIEALAEREFARILESEQRVVGWDA